MQIAVNQFRTIDQLREFEPGRTYLWDLNFNFKPFRSAYNQSITPGISSKIPTSSIIAWIPAESLSETAAIVNSADITVGQTGFRFPSGTTAKEVTINFIDDYKSLIFTWLKSWMDDVILCGGEGVNFLSECVDILTINDLLPNKEIISNTTRKYYVYPDGPISNSYSSDSGIKVYSVNFVVVGKV